MKLEGFQENFKVTLLERPPEKSCSTSKFSREISMKIFSPTFLKRFPYKLSKPSKSSKFSKIARQQASQATQACQAHQASQAKQAMLQARQANRICQPKLKSSKPSKASKPTSKVSKYSKPSKDAKPRKISQPISKPNKTSKLIRIATKREASNQTKKASQENQASQTTEASPAKQSKQITEYTQPTTTPLACLSWRKGGREGSLLGASNSLKIGYVEVKTPKYPRPCTLACNCKIIWVSDSGQVGGLPKKFQSYPFGEASRKITFNFNFFQRISL